LPADPSLLEAAEVVRWLGSDATRGLSAAEATARRERFGPNRLDAAPPVPAWRKLVAQLADPLIYLLLGAGVVSIVAWASEGARGADRGDRDHQRSWSPARCSASPRNARPSAVAALRKMAAQPRA
jgi:hypothetical protein